MERGENEGGRGGILREGVDDEVKVGMGEGGLEAGWGRREGLQCLY